MTPELNPVEFAMIVDLGGTFGLEASPAVVEALDDREAPSVEALIGKIAMGIHLPGNTILDVETPDHKHLKFSASAPEAIPA